MYQIDNASAVPALPAPAAGGAPGFFSDGDPVAGAPGTVVSADWLNAVQGELLAVLLAVGLAPSKANRSQIAGAMPLVSGNSLVFPSGVIVNFGNDTHTDGSGAQPVAFSTPFKTGAFVSLATNNAGGPPTAAHGTGNHTLNGMMVYSAGLATGAAAGAGTAFRWIAIGR